MDETVFYKKRLTTEECGLVVVTDKFISIHETRCFHFCVPSHRLRTLKHFLQKDETLIQRARRTKCLRRVSKQGSRIAFTTEEEALKHLKFLKKRQLSHMKRETRFVSKFLETDDLEEYGPNHRVPDSEELVREYCVFE